MNLAILILAAGASRRMGRDKLIEPIDGQPLLRRTANRAIAAGVGPVHVALPPAPHPRWDTIYGLDVTPTAVANADEGMNASLRAGVSALPDCAGVLLMLADLPDLTPDDLRAVAARFSETHEVTRGATEDGKPGHPVVFPAALFPDLLQLSGDSGAQSIVQANPHHLVSLPGENARTDLDTPNAWAAWRAKQRP